MKAYTCTDKFAWRNLDGKIVILNTHSGDYFTLNETASVVWEGLMEGHDSTEIVKRLVSEFDVDSNRAVTDVESLISSFTHDGFLTSPNPS